MTVWSDSHCHLAMVDPSAADAALQRARSAGLRGFLVPATKLDDAEPAIALARRHPDVWAAVGFHPHEAKDFEGAGEEQTSRLSADEQVVAIGEIGLDYHYDFSPRDVQREVFMKQIALGRERNLPVIIHNRESSDDLRSLLSSAEARGVRGVLHSFTENLEIARELIELGFYISFSGIVTFRSAESLREVAREIPMERMLIETDTPFLAPVPFRGKENEPAFVIKTAEVIAALRGVPLEKVAEATSRNFEELFGVTISS